MTVGVPEAPVDNANGKQQSLNLEPHFEDALGKWISLGSLPVVFSKSQQDKEILTRTKYSCVRQPFVLREFERLA